MPEPSLFSLMPPAHSSAERHVHLSIVPFDVFADRRLSDEVKQTPQRRGSESGQVKGRDRDLERAAPGTRQHRLFHHAKVYLTGYMVIGSFSDRRVINKKPMLYTGVDFVDIGSGLILRAFVNKDIHVSSFLSHFICCL